MKEKSTQKRNRFRTTTFLRMDMQIMWSGFLEAAFTYGVASFPIPKHSRTSESWFRFTFFCCCCEFSLFVVFFHCWLFISIIYWEWMNSICHFIYHRRNAIILSPTSTSCWFQFKLLLPLSECDCERKEFQRDYQNVVT